MKSLLKLTILFAFFSCTSVKQVGKLTIVADRNIDSKTDYVLLRSYMGGSTRELKRLKGKTLEDAIDNVVRNTPGGEFLKNARIYLVNGTMFAVEGDVWGIKGDQNFKGFHVGDKVQWSGAFSSVLKGMIVELKNETVCIVKLESNGNLKEVRYSELKKDF